MSKLPFIVRNARPRRNVVVHGRILPAGIKGGKSEMGLTEEQFLDASILRLLKLRRLEIVSAPEGWRPPAAWLAELEGEEAPPEAEEPEVIEEDEDEDSPPGDDDSSDDDDQGSEDTDTDTDTEEDSEESDEEDEPDAEEDEGEDDSEDDDSAVSWTREELEGLERSDLVHAAKEAGVKASGKSVDIIDSILASQEES